MNQRQEIIVVWTTLKNKITKSREVVVYQSWTSPKPIPAEQTIDYPKYQTLMNELGVNTLGINQPARTWATYEEVLEAIKEYKTKTLERAQKHYCSEIDLESSLKRQLASKLERVKKLIADDEIEKLKELCERGEI